MGVNKRALKASLAASAAALCLVGTTPAGADDANPAAPPTVATEIVLAPAAATAEQPILAAETVQKPTLLQKILNAVAAAAGAVAIVAVFSRRALRGVFVGLAKAPRAAAQAAANPRKALSSLARFIRGILIRAGMIAAGAVAALFVAGEFIAAIADPLTVAILGAGGLAGWAAWRGARKIGSLAFGRGRRADTTATID